MKAKKIDEQAKQYSNEKAKKGKAHLPPGLEMWMQWRQEKNIIDIMRNFNKTIILQNGITS